MVDLFKEIPSQPGAEQGQPVDLLAEIPAPETRTAEGRGVTSSFQFMSEGINQFADAVLGIPDALITTAANIPAPPGFPGSVQTPEGGIRGVSLFETITGRQAPAVGEDVLPIPSAEEIRAGISAAVPSTGPLDVQQRFELARAEQEQRKQEFPISTVAGQVAGDVATIATGRAPFVTSVARRQAAGPGTVVARFVGPGAERAIREAFKSKGVASLARGAGRSVEAGLEGATIAILQDGDPLEVAAYSAGGQAGGSALLKIGATKGGLLGVAGAATAATAAIQMAKTLTPGGNNFILPSVEEAFEKVTFALAAGALAGAAGAGRLRGRRFEDFPKFMDGLTTIPRASLISLVNDTTKDTDGRMEATMKTLAEDPEFFTPNERQQLNRALKSDKISLLDTINRMSKRKSFRNKLSEINVSGDFQAFPATAS